MILVTGATGFLGEFVVQNLIHQYSASKIRCFVRPTSDISYLQSHNLSCIQGDFEDKASFEKALADADTLVNVASLGFGHTPDIVSACAQQQIKRAIFISTTAIFTTLNSSSKSTRIQAEDLIQNAPIDYTILRPTMIYGTQKDRNISRLIQFICKFPVIPIFGPGTFLQQPVYVNDVARAVTQCLETPTTVHKAYNIAGAVPLTYQEIIDTICNLVNKRRIKLSLPLGLSLKLIRATRSIPGLPKLQEEQLLRLNENKIFDIALAQDDFGYAPRDFKQGVQRQMQSMNLVDK